jgi:DNA-binding NarL/FixJ family response regulator
MDLSTAKATLEALADGVDPRTGEVLDPGSPIESVQVVRALQLGVAAIDREMRKVERRSALPENAGKPWADEQDKALADLFDSGRTVANIAKELQRTRGSIASRLVRLGKVSDRQSAFVANLNLDQPNYGEKVAGVS